MSRVVLNVSVSLDGFTAGPNVREAEPMGDGGERLHTWLGGDGPDAEARRRLDESVGATIIGRRTFDLGLKPWGGTPWAGVPSFVVTHRPGRDFVGDNGGPFAFDDLPNAVRRAKAAAGDKDVIVLGNHVATELLRANLLDVVDLHVVPVLLGSGTRLFGGVPAELVAEREPTAGTATHLRFRVR